QAVDALDLLLLTKLQSVSEDLGAPPTVLAGSVVAPFDGALVLETAVPFEKELHTLTPAEPADGIGVTSHYASCLVRTRSTMERCVDAGCCTAWISLRWSAAQTRRRFGGRQPLCGIGVTSLM